MKTTIQEVQQNKAASEFVNKIWEPSKDVQTFDSLKHLKQVVISDSKKGIERIYYVLASLISTSQENNPLGERYTTKDTESGIRSNVAIRNLAKSWADCGNQLANPPLIRFSDDFKSLFTVHGNSRTKALSIVAGVKYIPIRVKLPSQMTMEQATRMAIDENKFRSPVSPYSQVMKIHSLRASKMTFTEIAKQRGITVLTASRYNDVAKCKILAEALRGNRFKIAFATAVASHPTFKSCYKNRSKRAVLQVLLKRIGSSRGADQIKMRDWYPGSPCDGVKIFCDLLWKAGRSANVEDLLIKVSQQDSAGTSIIRLSVARNASNEQRKAAIKQLTALNN